MVSRCALLLSTGLSAMLTSPANTQTVTAGLKNVVVFTEYSTLSTSTELVRRLFSSLSALRLNQEGARAGTTLRGQSIDLASESFSIYVPAHAYPPLHGYSLLVFVPPWSRAEVPFQWIPALDRHDMILVTPANAGNDANTVDRREPLALLGALNAMAVFGRPAAGLYRRFLRWLTGCPATRARISRCLPWRVAQRWQRSHRHCGRATAASGTLPPVSAEPHPNRLVECRARIDEELTTQLKQVEDSFARGENEDREAAVR